MPSDISLPGEKAIARRGLRTGSFLRALDTEGIVRFIRGIVKSALASAGYDSRNWLRIAQIRAWEAHLAADAPTGDVLEISPAWNSPWKALAGPGYTAASFPQFDVTRDRLERRFRFVIADQVLEHVRDPLAAVRNIRAMLRPDGCALIATPFLFRVHQRPGDYWRWTEDGLRLLLAEGGFDAGRVETASWGNARCARAHLGSRVKAFGFGRDLSNDPALPLMVWAIARA